MLADYKAAKRMETAQRDADVAYRAAVLDRMARGYIVPSALGGHSGEAPDKDANVEKNEDSDDDAELNNLLGCDADDELFMREFRARRLKGRWSSY